MSRILIPELWKNTTNNVYQYQYFFDFDDKVYYTRADDNTTTKLLNEISDMKTSGELEQITFATYDDVFNNLESMDVELYNTIKTVLSNSLTDIIQRKVVDIELTDGKLPHHDVWVNYQQKHEYVPSHTHDGMYSFVWYLDIPIEIMNEHKNNNKTFETHGLIEFSSKRDNGSMVFSPKTADVFIFKSTHSHQVYPFYSDNTRISMAGNIHSITFEDGETITV